MASKEIVSNLNKNYNVLAICDNLNPEKNILETYKLLLKKYKKVCVITTNRLSSTLMTTFDDNRIDYSNCFFIDCVSSKLMKAVSNDKVYYLPSPHALTELSLKFSSIIGKYDLVIFDNLDSLLLYNSEVFVLRFLNSIMSRVQQKKIKALYWIMLEGKKKIVSDISLFVDSTVLVK
ncbi:Uncharacterised protein [uncultured archaeon]|nr:Uncharacterised protein [uncultured archaeon]